MDYQIIVIREMHHDASRNVVKGSRPLNTDSFNVIKKNLFLGVAKIFQVVKGSQHYKG